MNSLIDEKPSYIFEVCVDDLPLEDIPIGIDENILIICDENDQEIFKGSNEQLYKMKLLKSADKILGEFEQPNFLNYAAHCFGLWCQSRLREIFYDLKNSEQELLCQYFYKFCVHELEILFNAIDVLPMAVLKAQRKKPDINNHVLLTDGDEFHSGGFIRKQDIEQGLITIFDCVRMMSYDKEPKIEYSVPLYLYLGYKSGYREFILRPMLLDMHHWIHSLLVELEPLTLRVNFPKYVRAGFCFDQFNPVLCEGYELLGPCGDRQSEISTVLNIGGKDELVYCIEDDISKISYTEHSKFGHPSIDNIQLNRLVNSLFGVETNTVFNPENYIFELLGKTLPDCFHGKSIELKVDQNGTYAIETTI